MHPGSDVLLACLLFVQGGSDPTSNSSDAFADLSVFGGASAQRVSRCPACGGPPWTFDMDLDIPGDMSPGLKTFPIWAIDPRGNRADGTASIEVVSR
jgi:hypothetical protein